MPPLSRDAAIRALICYAPPDCCCRHAVFRLFFAALLLPALYATLLMRAIQMPAMLRCCQSEREWLRCAAPLSDTIQKSAAAAICLMLLRYDALHDALRVIMSCYMIRYAADFCFYATRCCLAVLCCAACGAAHMRQRVSPRAAPRYVDAMYAVTPICVRRCYHDFRRCHYWLRCRFLPRQRVADAATASRCFTPYRR